MRLMTYSMHWLWKATFVAVAFWGIIILAEAWGKHSVDGAVTLFALGPLALWILIRWIRIRE